MNRRKVLFSAFHRRGWIMSLKSIFGNKWLFMAVVGLAVIVLGGQPAPAHAGQGGVPQSSITLAGSDVALCNKTDTDWSLSKEVTRNDGSTVTWTVTATKGDVSDNFLVVNGFIAVTNTGTADATIGNIVVNLQQQINQGTVKKPKWVWTTVSSDVADATDGNGATTVYICPSASSEGLGSFTENSASGKLEFTDADSNTIWAITPQETIPPGQTVNLLFSAIFDNTVLGIPEGGQIRVEAIVSFGNAGSRSDKSSCANIDINGNGSLDDDEAYVRGVPTRVTEVIPALDNCNSSPTLTDTGVTATGTVTHGDIDYTPDSDWDSGQTIQDTTSFTVTASTVDGGTDGGTICNGATLKGESCGVSVIIGYETVTNPDGSTTQEPIYHDFYCCVGVDLSASDCANIGAVSAGFEDGDYCTYGRTGTDGYGKSWNSSNGSPTSLQILLTNNFPHVLVGGSVVSNPDVVSNPAFPDAANLTIGDASAGNPPYYARWQYAGVNETGGSSPPCNGVICYLAGQSGTSGSLMTADTTNPTSTSGGNLTGSLTCLAINVGLGRVYDQLATLKMPINAGSDGDVGALELCNLKAGTQINGTNWTLTTAQAAALNGQTISQVLAALNTAVSNGALTPPYGATYANLNDLAAQLNGAFPGDSDLTSCSVSSWAAAYLCKP
jgi:hypothetical protein